MRRNAAAECAVVVTAFETRHDAPAGVRIRHRLDAPGQPFVVGLDQAELPEFVLAVGIEARGDEDHLRRKTVQRRQPERLDQFAHPGTARVCRDRHVDHVAAQRMIAAVRIEAALEDADHQDAFVAGNDVLGAVAMVDIEVDDGDALEATDFERVSRRDRPRC